MRSAAAALAALALALSGCSGGGGTDPGVVVGEGLITEWQPGQGPALPALAGQSIEGERLSVAPGKPVLVNLWATWCGPCKDEAPVLSELAAEFGEQVSFVGVNVRDTGDRAASVTFHEKYGLDYPSLDDKDGALALALRGLTGSGYPPQTLVVGADGKVVARIGGEVQESVLRTVLEDVTAKGGATTS